MACSWIEVEKTYLYYIKSIKEFLVNYRTLIPRRIPQNHKHLKQRYYSIRLCIILDSFIIANSNIFLLFAIRKFSIIKAAIIRNFKFMFIKFTLRLKVERSIWTLLSS
jgi:hypothetical protein